MEASTSTSNVVLIQQQLYRPRRLSLPCYKYPSLPFSSAPLPTSTTTATAAATTIQSPLSNFPLSFKASRLSQMPSQPLQSSGSYYH